MEIAEILRLKTLGHSQRQISKLSGFSRNTIKEYWSLSKEQFLDLQKKKDQGPSWTQLVDWNWVQAELQRKTSRTILHRELSDGFEGKIPNYQNFCKYLSSQFSGNPSEKISLPRERIAGRYLEVDYSGDKVEILIPSTGELRSAELYVGALGYSSKVFAEFTWTQQLPDFLSSHVNCFEFFGGTVEILVPDNCKTAITKASKLDPVINRSYQSLAEHYGCVVDPADPYRPKHKAVVEKSVQLIQTEFIASIRDKTYTSLQELNRDLRSFLDRVNDRPIKGRGQSRNALAELENL